MIKETTKQRREREIEKLATEAFGDMWAWNNRKKLNINVYCAVGVNRQHLAPIRENLDGSVIELALNFNQAQSHFTVGRDLSFQSPNLTTLRGFPITVAGDLSIIRCKIPDLRHCTQECYGDFMLSACYEMESLEGAPRKIWQTIKLVSLHSLTDLLGLENTKAPKLTLDDMTGIKSFKQIVPHLKEIPVIEVDVPISDPMLALKSPCIKQIEYDRNGYHQDSDKYDLAIRIINRHLMASRDIISCKRELVTAGLKEYATYK